jgi:hypothetical protein
MVADMAFDRTQGLQQNRSRSAGPEPTWRQTPAAGFTQSGDAPLASIV